MLDTLGIKQFFKRIEFTDKKDPELFLEMIGKDRNVLVVGDSIHREITVGNILGLITVRVLQGAFANQVPVSPLEKAEYEINDICDFPKILKIYEI